MFTNAPAFTGADAGQVVLDDDIVFPPPPACAAPASALSINAGRRPSRFVPNTMSTYGNRFLKSFSATSFCCVMQPNTPRIRLGFSSFSSRSAPILPNTRFSAWFAHAAGVLKRDNVRALLAAPLAHSQAIAAGPPPSRCPARSFGSRRFSI